MLLLSRGQEKARPSSILERSAKNQASSQLLHHSTKMFRTTLLRCARGATRQFATKPGAIARPAVRSALIPQPRFAPSAFQAVRCYSAASGLSKTEIEGRIIDLLKNFDKVRAYTNGHRRREEVLMFCRLPMLHAYVLTGTGHDSLELMSIALAYLQLCERPWVGQLGYC